MLGALTFAFVLGVLVVVHEYGHFIVARMVGIRVEKFSVGFGPVVFSKKKGDTEYCVSLLPLGGFVKLAGESADETKGLPDEFNSKTLLQKFAVVFAGPFMNAFLAFVLFAVIFMVGQPVATSKVGKIMDGSPAAMAGIKEGDKILSIDGEVVAYWEDMLAKIRSKKGESVFLVERAGAQQEIHVTPKTQEMVDLFGKKTTASFVGIAPSNEMVKVRSGFFKAVAMGFERVWTLTGLIFYSLWMMISGAMPFKDSLTGPIGIYFMTQSAAQMGLVYLFYFMGSLSVSLFVLNLLPLPALDGGHVLFIVIEKLKGSPLKDSTKERVTQGGVVVLLGLMAFVIFQDLSRFSVIDNILKVFHR